MFIYFFIILVLIGVCGWLLYDKFSKNGRNNKRFK